MGMQASSKILKAEGSHIPFRVTHNYTLRPIELEDECLYDYTEKYYISSNIPKNERSNTNCMLLHPDHPFHSKKVVRKRKIPVIADMIRPRLPHLFQISDEEFGKYSKMALLLFQPHISPNQLLGKYKTYSEAFIAFKNTGYNKSSQA